MKPHTEKRIAPFTATQISAIYKLGQIGDTFLPNGKNGLAYGHNKPLDLKCGSIIEIVWQTYYTTSFGIFQGIRRIS